MIRIIYLLVLFFYLVSAAAAQDTLFVVIGGKGKIGNKDLLTHDVLLSGDDIRIDSNERLYLLGGNGYPVQLMENGIFKIDSLYKMIVGRFNFPFQTKPIEIFNRNVIFNKNAIKYKDVINSPDRLGIFNCFICEFEKGAVHTISDFIEVECKRIDFKDQSSLSIVHTDFDDNILEDYAINPKDSSIKIAIKISQNLKYPSNDKEINRENWSVVKIKVSGYEQNGIFVFRKDAESSEIILNDLSKFKQMNFATDVARGIFLEDQKLYYQAKFCFLKARIKEPELGQYILTDFMRRREYAQRVSQER